MSSTGESVATSSSVTTPQQQQQQPTRKEQLSLSLDRQSLLAAQQNTSAASAGAAADPSAASTQSPAPTATSSPPAPAADAAGSATQAAQAATGTQHDAAEEDYDSFHAHPPGKSEAMLAPNTIHGRASAVTAASLMTPRDADIVPQDRQLDLFFRTHMAYVALQEEKAKGWSNSRVEESFKRMQINKAAQKDDPLQERMVKKMYTLLQELDEWKNWRIATKDVNLFLDIGAAPGGFARYILEHRPQARGIGLTLSKPEGGLSTEALEALPRYTFHLADVTTLRCKFLDMHDGFAFLPHEIVEVAGTFDLLLCDAHYVTPPARVSDMGKDDVLRAMKLLVACQLLLAYKLLRPGGKLIFKFTMKEQLFYAGVLAHLHHMFEKVDLVKPTTSFQLRSAFFALCFDYKDVPPEVERLEKLIASLRAAEPGPHGGDVVLYDTPTLIRDYGELLLKKYEPLWTLQKRWLQELGDDHLQTRPPAHPHNSNNAGGGGAHKKTTPRRASQTGVPPQGRASDVSHNRPPAAGRNKKEKRASGMVQSKSKSPRRARNNAAQPEQPTDRPRSKSVGGD